MKPTETVSNTDAQDTQAWAIKHVRAQVRLAWEAHAVLVAHIALRDSSNMRDFWRTRRNRLIDDARAYFIAGHKIGLHGCRAAKFPRLEK
jgi:hypothetical protein